MVGLKLDLEIYILFDDLVDKVLCILECGGEMSFVIFFVMVL